MAVDNPLDEGFSDLGLVSAVDADVLGSPDKVAELQAQLGSIQAMLGTPPPKSNDWVSAAIQGAIQGAGSGSVLVNPVTGEQVAAPQQSGGFGAGFLGGIQSAIEGQQAQALVEYQHRQDQAQKAMAQKEALAAGIRMTLAQNPQALAALGATEEGRRTIGMLGYFQDVEVDPLAKQRQVDASLAEERRLKYLEGVMKNPNISRAKRAQAFKDYKDVVDPNGELDIQEADFIGTAAGSRMPKFSDAVKYGDSGAQAWNQLQLDGDLVGYHTRLSKLGLAEKPVPLSSRDRVKTELLKRIAQVQSDYKDVNPDKELSQLDAIKTMGEEDQLLAAEYLKTADEDGLTLQDHGRLYAQAYDDVPDNIKKYDPVEAATAADASYRYRLGQIRKAKKAQDKANRRTTPPPPPSTKVLPADTWGKLLGNRTGTQFGGKAKNGVSPAEAERALVNEYIRGGKADQIPPAARKRTGM